MRFEKSDYVIQGIESVELPRMVRVRQKFGSKTVADPAAELRAQMRATVDPAAVKGKRIAISAGSRGVPRYSDLIKTIVGQLKEWGADPFVFPAMGSHAGANAEGQKDYLAQFGITEDVIGCPVRSTMETVAVAELDDGFPVWCDKYAAEADGIVLFNKIKPHTHFKGRHESGLLKMICIGVGKHKGAATFHQYGFDDFCRNMERVAGAFLEKKNVVFAVGMVQNAYDDVGVIEVIPPDRIFERDAALLEIAKRELAQIKLRDIDVLIIDEIGKEISGMGFDPNVTGRIDVRSQQEAFRAIAPTINKIVLLDITEFSHGLGIGMGLADIVSFRFVNKLDFSATYTNIITNNYLMGAAMPVYANSDLDAIKIALMTSMVKDRSRARIVRIKNTTELEEIEVSEGCLPLLAGRDDMEIISEPRVWSFNADGDLW